MKENRKEHCEREREGKDTVSVIVTQLVRYLQFARVLAAASGSRNNWYECLASC